MPFLAVDITSQWIAADNTDHRAEVAETEVPGLCAVRANGDRTRVIYLTADQILELAARAMDRDSELGRALENGRRREHNGHRNGHRDRDARDRDARDRDRDRDDRDRDARDRELSAR